MKKSIRTTNLATLFEQQCSKTPNNIAVCFEEIQLTYQVVNTASNQLARYLREHNITQNSVVGLCISRGIELPIALLAILKTGATYLPIDPSYPKERIKYMLEDAQAHHVITQTIPSLQLPKTLNTILLDDFEKPWEKKDSQNLNISIKSIDPAYIIYTSGSTGKPKGIVQTHQTIENLITWQATQFSEESHLNISQFAAFGFDVSLQEIFFALLNGHTLVITPQKIREELNLLPEFVSTNKINVLFLPTSVLEYFTHESLAQGTILTELKSIIVAGETLHITDSIRQFFEINQNICLNNQYGPSETHVVSNYILPQRPKDWPNSPPIGKAISNTDLHVLDESLKPANTGELYISGCGVAKHYLNLPEKTKKQFANIQVNGKIIRAYRSGDKVKILKDSNLEYVERFDSQVKIRGYRIELSEIEATVLQHEEVRECVVIVNQAEKRKYLTAYITPKTTQKEINLTSIKTFLQKTLPDYMIPSAFIALENLPMTTNMKVDKSQLAESQPPTKQNKKVVPAKTNGEKELLQIFSEVLGISHEDISIDEDIYNLGVDSIAAMQILSRLKTQYFVNISPKKFFSTQNIKSLCTEIIRLLKKGKTEIVDFTKYQEKPNKKPLTPAQKSLWFIQNLEPKNPFYNESSIISLKGNLNKAALKLALNEIIQRHVAFQTKLSELNGEVLQNITNKTPKNALIERNVTIQNKQEKEEIIRDIIEKPFKLINDFLYRFYLITDSPESHTLILVFHHIIIDGWSIDILLRELTLLYNAHSNKKSIKLAPLNYEGIWEDQNKFKPSRIKQLEYWKKNLNDIESIKWPTSQQKFLQGDHEGANICFKVGKKATKNMIALSTQKKTTLFNILTSCLATAVNKYTKQENFAIGTSASTRNFKHLEELVGFFSNTIALKSSFNKNITFSSLLKQTQNSIFDAQKNADIPFNEIVSHLCSKRDRMKNPVFQIFIGLEPLSNFKPKLTKETKIIKLPKSKSKFDITLLFDIKDNELLANFEYSKNTFSEKMANHFIQHFTKILSIVCKKPNIKIADIDILTQNEKNLLLKKYNQTTVKKNYKMVHQLFENQAKKIPNSTAVIFNDQKISYSEINQKATQLASYLKSWVEPNSIIAVCLPRSPEMIISIFAILKLGSAFLPIDLNFPASRIRYLINDSKTNLLITNSDIESLHSLKKIKTIFLDREQNNIKFQKSLNLNTINNVNNLIYVIYTSGSTGQPKGVMLSHKNVFNTLTSIVHTLKISTFERTLSNTTFSFDIAYLEIFIPLIFGKELILTDCKTSKDPKKIIAIIKKYEATLLQAVPSFWSMLFSTGMKLNHKNFHAIVGGEELTKNLAEKFVSNNIPTWNVYGPTETTIWSTICKLNKKNINSPPIGKPIDNTTIYILNKDLSPTPAGIYGELHIAGDSISQGYINSKNLTKEKFINNPFNASPYQILYKTGDLAYWSEKGDLFFVGRNDSQIKLRGFRIDTKEIDYKISQITHVIDSYTQVVGNNSKLVSYVHSNPQPKASDDSTEKQLLDWQKVWQSVYENENAKIDKFDTSGWISSFTSESLSIQEMKEWVACSTNRILDLHPKHVLEIGCGTGLMLEPILNNLQSYHGIDISTEVIEKLSKKYTSNLFLTFESLQAHEIKKDKIKSFDTVIINSVIQYFPNIQYLENVLKTITNNMPAGGKIYIGDIRNFDLLELFHCAVLLENKNSPKDYAELLRKAKNHAKNEKELNISPNYFYLITHKFKRKCVVEIQLRRGLYPTEMNLFRYDAIIHLDEQLNEPTNLKQFNYRENVTDIKTIEKNIKRHPCTIKDIPNKLFSNFLQKLESKYQISKQLKNAIEPESIYKMLTQLGAQYQLQHSTNSPFCFDITPKKKCNPEKKSNDFLNLYNDPLKTYKKQLLKLNILKELKSTLPDYMIPNSIIILDKFPKTLNGKLDKKALPKPEETTTINNQLLPKTETEKKLSTIWQKLLGVSRIDKQNNFFELGGHSLLSVQLLSEINEKFNTDLPVKTIFQAQSIEEMAKLIDKIKKIKKTFS